MLFWIFLVRCSSRSIVIFLIVSKEIRKYDQRKFYFFCRKETFSYLVFTFIAKKKLQKKFTMFFSVNQNCKTKKIAISKISNKKFRKHQIQKTFAKILWKKSSQNIFVKRKIFAKKNLINKIFTKKNFRKKNFSKKEIRKKFFENKIRKKFKN